MADVDQSKDEMDALRELVAAMDEPAFERLRQAVEIGRWPDGVALDDEQRRYAMQATMLYQAWHGGSDQHLQIAADGTIIHKPKSELKTQFRAPSADDAAIARFDHDDI